MSKDASTWLFRRGELASEGWETLVDEHRPAQTTAKADGSIVGWQHTGVRVARLAPGADIELEGTGFEKLIVPLAGSFRVHSGGSATVLQGRASVFAGPTDVLYLGSQSGSRIEAVSGGADESSEARVLVATSPTAVVRPDRYIPVDEVPVELRGAGASSRQVHNFGRKESLDAARFIVVEVITPAENWSSYPPHKHDVASPGHESELEEIYYFEAAPARGSAPEVGAEHAFGMFSTYSSEAGEIAIDGMVRTGDVALVPFGYHGPAVAAPGYDLYYLNVMAGPDPDRTWLISDDPAHAWVRDSWDGQQLDPRLPYTSRDLA